MMYRQVQAIIGYDLQSFLFVAFCWCVGACFKFWRVIVEETGDILHITIDECE